MLPASRAATVPVFMATPTSAWASAGASLVPSPHIATSLPLACSSRISCSLSSGVACGEEVVDAGLGGDGGGGHRVVAGDHHGADAHAAQLGEALADAALDDVLEVDDAEQRGRPWRRRAACRRPWRSRRRSPAPRGRLGVRAAGSARCCRCATPERRRDIGEDRVDGALADRRAADVDAAHPGLRGEGHEGRAELGHVAAADAVLLLGQHDDRAALRRLVGERGELRRVGELLLGDAAHRAELGRLAVAEGDGAGLVEQQRVDVARRLDRAARHGEHVEAHQPVHAGDADGREQRADRGRDQGDEQRDQHDDRDRAAGIGREARDRTRREDEDDGQARRAGC